MRRPADREVEARRRGRSRSSVRGERVGAARRHAKRQLSKVGAERRSRRLRSAVGDDRKPRGRWGSTPRRVGGAEQDHRRSVGRLTRERRLETGSRRGRRRHRAGRRAARVAIGGRTIAAGPTPSSTPPVIVRCQPSPRSTSPCQSPKKYGHEGQAEPAWCAGEQRRHADAGLEVAVGPSSHPGASGTRSSCGSASMRPSASAPDRGPAGRCRRAAGPIGPAAGGASRTPAASKSGTPSEGELGQGARVR